MSKSHNFFQLPHLIESKIIFEESLVKIRRDQLQVNEQSPYFYYTLITYPFAVAILASTPEGAYILNEEYRQPTGQVLLGCPGGYIEPKEDAIQAAQRELLEETGYQAKSLTLMGSAFPYAGFTGQKTIYIRAYEATFVAAPKLEASEMIRPRLLMPKEVLALVKKGTELDGILGTALFFNQLQSSQED